MRRAFFVFNVSSRGRTKVEVARRIGAAAWRSRERCTAAETRVKRRRSLA
jgi:hypothetical protein